MHNEVEEYTNDEEFAMRSRLRYEQHSSDDSDIPTRQTTSPSSNSTSFQRTPPASAMKRSKSNPSLSDINDLLLSAPQQQQQQQAVSKAQAELESFRKILSKGICEWFEIDMYCCPQ